MRDDLTKLVNQFFLETEKSQKVFLQKMQKFNISQEGICSNESSLFHNKEPVEILKYYFYGYYWCKANGPGPKHLLAVQFIIYM